jgi:hypothetical protein
MDIKAPDLLGRPEVAIRAEGARFPDLNIAG